MRGTEVVGTNPVLDFGIDRGALGYVGHDLQRPECILAEPDGALWVADARGGVVRLQDGRQDIITQRQSDTSIGPGRRRRGISRAPSRTGWPSPVTARS